MAKNLKKGSFANRMYKKGIRRGKHVSKNRAMRVMVGLDKSGKGSQSTGASKVAQSIHRSLGKRSRLPKMYR